MPIGIEGREAYLEEEDTMKRRIALLLVICIHLSELNGVYTEDFTRLSYRYAGLLVLT